jgi:hypothetical protein
MYSLCHITKNYITSPPLLLPSLPSLKIIVLYVILTASNAKQAYSLLTFCPMIANHHKTTSHTQLYFDFITHPIFRVTKSYAKQFHRVFTFVLFCKHIHFTVVWYLQDLLQNLYCFGEQKSSVHLWGKTNESVGCYDTPCQSPQSTACWRVQKTKPSHQTFIS